MNLLTLAGEQTSIIANVLILHEQSLKILVSDSAESTIFSSMTNDLSIGGYALGDRIWSTEWKILKYAEQDSKSLCQESRFLRY